MSCLAQTPLSLSISSTKGSYEASELVVLKGKVSDPYGSPISNVEVSIEITNPLGGLAHMALAYSGTDGLYLIQFALRNDATTGTYAVHATASKPGCGVATTQTSFSVISLPSSHSASLTTQITAQANRCLIATATFGSELSPEVQLLRDFRDRMALSTFSGRQFMAFFNQFYYSFSPQVAQFLVDRPTFREVVKYVLYPLIWILYLAAVMFSSFAFNPELGIIVSGFTASSLIGLVYFSPLAIAVLSSFKRFGAKLLETSVLPPVALWFLSVGLMAVAEIEHSSTTMIVGTVTFTTTTALLSAILPASKILEGRESRKIFS